MEASSSEVRNSGLDVEKEAKACQRAASNWQFVNGEPEGTMASMACASLHCAMAPLSVASSSYVVRTQSARIFVSRIQPGVWEKAGAKRLRASSQGGSSSGWLF